MYGLLLAGFGLVSLLWVHFFQPREAQRAQGLDWSSWLVLRTYMRWSHMHTIRPRTYMLEGIQRLDSFLILGVSPDLF